MHAIRSLFIYTIIRFILEHDGIIDTCREVGDYITEASRIADEKQIEPPCLNFQKFYSNEIYRMQKEY